MSESFCECPICKEYIGDCHCESDFIEEYDNCYCYDENGNWK